MAEALAPQFGPVPREPADHAGTATPIAMVVGFVLGDAGAHLIQRRGADDAPGSAVLKAALAGIRR